MGALEESVYHVELRQFPHNSCRFNLSEKELRASVLELWARERIVELGERKWSPHQATLTVLQGPPIPFAQLTMGRGWRAAQRSGREVTDELLAAVRAELGEAGEMREVGGPAGAPAAAGAPAEGISSAAAVSAQTAKESPDEQRVAELAADSFGLELLAQLGGESMSLHRAWELAAQRSPQSPASATLALAERAVASLLRAGLVVLVEAARAEGGASVDGEDGASIDGERAAGVVRLPASWSLPGAAGGVSMRRV